MGKHRGRNRRDRLGRGRLPVGRRRADHSGRGFVLAFLLILPLWGAGALPGAAEMDRLLDTEAVSFGAAARWILDAAGFPSEVWEEEAFITARREGLLPPGAESGDPVRLDELAFMLAQAFGFKGGIMYALIPGPRYAYRELRYRGILEGRIDPAQTVSGERLLHLLGRILEQRGER